MEHMILWAICSLMALLTMIGMGTTKPVDEDEDEHEHHGFGVYKIDHNWLFKLPIVRFIKLIFGSIVLGTPFWGFFEFLGTAQE